MNYFVEKPIITTSFRTPISSPTSSFTSSFTRSPTSSFTTSPIAIQQSPTNTRDDTTYILNIQFKGRVHVFHYKYKNTPSHHPTVSNKRTVRPKTRRSKINC